MTCARVSACLSKLGLICREGVSLVETIAEVAASLLSIVIGQNPLWLGFRLEAEILCIPHAIAGRAKRPKSNLAAVGNDAFFRLYMRIGGGRALAQTVRLQRSSRLSQTK